MQSVVIFALLACCAEIVVTQERIVDGFQIDISEAPYQVAVYKHGRIRCGGSIIGVDKILTAAHVAGNSFPLNYLSVRVGSTHSAGGQSFSVRALHQHPQFVRDTMINDVTVLYLSNPLTYGPNIQPIKLAQNRPDPTTMLLVTGWGETKPHPCSTKEYLWAVFVPLMNQDDCEELYSDYLYKVTDVMVCAGYKEGGKDSCFSDSGGPLVNNATGEQVGIVSWGCGCAMPNKPGVYASVPDLLDFIESV